MTQILISLPFAFLRVKVFPNGNAAGIEANVAYYGFGLITYAVFNLIFLTRFFKTAYKAGNAFLTAVIPAFSVVAVMEVLVHFPKFHWSDSITPYAMLKQLSILVIGIAVYVLSIFTAYLVSVKRFEQVDL